MLEINEFNCYEVKIEESEQAGSCQESNPGHLWLERPVLAAVVAQWQSTGGSSQRCPRFDSRRLPAFSLSSIFAS